MFYFRINRLKIVRNREQGFLFFRKDLAEVRIISFVTTSNTDLPQITDWLATNDPQRKQTILAQAVAQVVASRILTQVDRVKDNAILTFGDTGYVLYQSPTIPDDFNWCLIAIESDQKARQVEAQFRQLTTKPAFQTLASNLELVVRGASNPKFAAGVAVAQFITSAIASSLKEQGDDQIGLLYMSLNRREHYPHGERKQDNVPDLTNNLRIDYSIFGFE